MKRTSLAVLMIALALVALAAPLAYAQAPAPKVTINGLIDNVTSYSQNMANYNGGLFNRKDSMWYYRTRGRFDIIGEVGKAKGVLGLELDHVFGQAGSNDSTIVNAGAASGTAVQTGFGTDGSFDLNTDSRGIIEIKWLYVEFPMPLIPVPTTARLGAQPFGALATYKLATYATGDFPGVSITSQITPNFKLVGTYVQVEESLAGTQTKNGLAVVGSGAHHPVRGDDFAGILCPRDHAVQGPRHQADDLDVLRPGHHERQRPCRPRRPQHHHRVLPDRRRSRRHQRVPLYGGPGFTAPDRAVLSRSDRHVPVRQQGGHRAGQPSRRAARCRVGSTTPTWMPGSSTCAAGSSSGRCSSKPWSRTARVTALATTRSAPSGTISR